MLNGSSLASDTCGKTRADSYPFFCFYIFYQKHRFVKRAFFSKNHNVGKVYRGETKYIDREPKKQRNYVVVLDDGRKVTVAKLKSIKIFDENGKNADRALVEINASRYGLEKRTGVDFQRFNKNRMSGKPLSLKDKKVFPEQKERFTLSNRDIGKALYHTGIKKREKKK